MADEQFINWSYFMKSKTENKIIGKFVLSTDGVRIQYQETGSGKVCLVFVHGWLGNIEWWKHQEDFFRDAYKIVRIDLGGHGKSDRTRSNWTAKQYAEDIEVVINCIDASEIILVGHSMSGAYALEAKRNLSRVTSIILVDTLKDLDHNFTLEQAEQFLFSEYRKDFKFAVENIMPQYLFSLETPESIKVQLQSEFLQNSAEVAINALKPLYGMDVRNIAKSISVPVRAINSDSTPTNLESNNKYFKNYSYRAIAGTGHYPMLERPNEFNEILKEVLLELTLGE